MPAPWRRAATADTQSLDYGGPLHAAGLASPATWPLAQSTMALAEPAEYDALRLRQALHSLRVSLQDKDKEVVELVKDWQEAVDECERCDRKAIKLRKLAEECDLRHEEWRSYAQECFLLVSQRLSMAAQLAAPFVMLEQQQALQLQCWLLARRGWIPVRLTIGSGALTYTITSRSAVTRRTRKLQVAVPLEGVDSARIDGDILVHSGCCCGVEARWQWTCLLAATGREICQQPALVFACESESGMEFWARELHSAKQLPPPPSLRVAHPQQLSFAGLAEPAKQLVAASAPRTAARARARGGPLPAAISGGADADASAAPTAYDVALANCSGAGSALRPDAFAYRPDASAYRPDAFAVGADVSADGANDDVFSTPASSLAAAHASPSRRGLLPFSSALFSGRRAARPAPSTHDEPIAPSHHPQFDEPHRGPLPATAREPAFGSDKDSDDEDSRSDRASDTSLAVRRSSSPTLQMLPGAPDVAASPLALPPVSMPDGATPTASAAEGDAHAPGVGACEAEWAADASAAIKSAPMPPPPVLNAAPSFQQSRPRPVVTGSTPTQSPIGTPTDSESRPPTADRAPLPLPLPSAGRPPPPSRSVPKRPSSRPSSSRASPQSRPSSQAHLPTPSPSTWRPPPSPAGPRSSGGFPVHRTPPPGGRPPPPGGRPPPPGGRPPPPPLSGSGRPPAPPKAAQRM